METEHVERHRSFCGGYQVLLRIDAIMHLPADERIASCYRVLFDRCMSWAEQYGGQLQAEYEATADAHLRAQMRARTYRLRIHPVFEDERLIVYLCESALMGSWKGPGEGYRRLSHVWNKKEAKMLPTDQIMSYFGIHLPKKRLPFLPDGIYPRDGKLIIFQNYTGKIPFREHSFELEVP